MFIVGHKNSSRNRLWETMIVFIVGSKEEYNEIYGRKEEYIF